MGEIVTRILFDNSNNSLEKIDSIQLADSPKTTDEDIFQLHDEQYSIVTHDSLDQALMKSLYHSTNPRPLALYIHDNESVLTQIFQETILWSESIGSYLNEQFVLWEWDFTSNNYAELLEIIVRHVGEEVAAIIASSTIDDYPLLICLIFDRGQIKVESIIQSLMSESEAFALLVQARDAFGSRFELPDTTGKNLTAISTENWLIPASTLTPVVKESDEFRRVAADFNGGEASVVRIDRIENMTWLFKYLDQKREVDNRLGHDESEKLLFHGCPYAAAEQILQHGFDHDRIGRNGSVYGRGFYFSNTRLLSDRYATPDPSTREKRILMCRVLVGRSCLGTSTTTTCPSNYDSTTNQSNIHVVYSNRHVLPEYLITYK